MSSTDKNKLLLGDSKSLLSSSSLMSKWSLKTELGTQSGLSLNTRLQNTGRLSSLDTSARKKKSDYDPSNVDRKTTTSSLQSTLLGPTKSNLALTGSSRLSSNLLGGLQTSSNLTSRLGSSSGLSSSLGTSSSLTSSLLLRSDQSKLTLQGSSQTKLDTGLGPKTEFSSPSLKENFQSGLLKSSTPVATIKIEPVSQFSYGSPLTSNRLSSQLSTEKTPTKRKSADQKTVKSRKKILSNDGRVTTISKYEVKPPVYKLEVDIKDYGIHIPDFVSPAKDPSLKPISKPLHDVNGMKLGFINAISGSLICQPNFRNSTDQTRTSLVTMAKSLVIYDPEFILKVALYTRKQLNIRTTANFLLAMAANIDMCRPFLKKYFKNSINLPSDWIEVAEIYQAFHDRNLTQGSLPSALRRAMIAKFPDFDEYQLAKYNKESSRKKKKKKEKKNEEGAPGGGARGGRGGRGFGRSPRGMDRGRGRGRGRGGRGGIVAMETKKKNMFDSSSDSSDSSDEEKENLHEKISGVIYDDEESKEEIEKTSFSLKQLIRKLHITEPVYHVMALIGKKYPSTLEDFYKCRLPGQWEEEKSGKRMKLPIPETWETQVSLKGNKASVWEELLDHKKLPFMAMLRNLRNLIRAGISNKHHNDVIKRLTNERQVVNSKQFPFRFFSAYEVLVQLEKEFEDSQQKIIQEAEIKAQYAAMGMPYGAERGGRGRGRGGRGRGRGRGGENQWWIEKRNKKKQESMTPKETPFDKNLIQRYRKALDTAVKIATVYNVQPIKGKTIVFCDVGENMDVNCTAARGLGKPRKMKEVAVLMGLMCKYSCENCEFVVFDEKRFDVITPRPGTILDNMADTLGALDKTRSIFDKKFEHNIPDSILIDALVDQQQIDNLIILSGGVDSTQQQFISFFLKKFRQLVNPNLLYANISFSGKGCGFSESIKPEHDNDIYITGFSDQILRFIAERGEGGQLLHVDKIDEFFHLKPMPIKQEAPRPTRSVSVEKPLPILSNTPSWRTFRVFISSTFRDMHGERDVLTRFIIPELRALAKKHFINIFEVDLRWGVTEEETKSNKTLELCLSEVSKCHFFIGILGDRYGYTPEKYIVPDTEEYDWLKEYPKGASVTELEMHAGVLMYPRQMIDKALMLIRNNSFIKDVPAECLPDFQAESPEAESKMNVLKRRVRDSPLNVINSYDCHWGGVVDGKPIVAGLEKFAMPVINAVWNSVRKQFPDEDAMLDETTHVTKQHEAMVENHRSRFVGRKNLIKECLKQMKEMTNGGILTMIGKAGTGKSAVLASLVTDYKDSDQCDTPVNLLVHIAGAAPGSTNIMATLRRLCYEIRRQFGLKAEVPEDYKNIVQKFGEMLGEAASLSGSPVVVFIDGLDLMETTFLPSTMDWLPNPVPKNVIFVISALEDGKFHNSLKRMNTVTVNVGPLDMWDKADVVRNTLAVHRKALDESAFNNQMKLLLSKREGANPLFLKLACEELRVFGVFERITLKLKGLPHTTPALLQDILSRMESDLGPDLVSTAISLLVCSRNGLQVEELHDVLSIQSIMNGDKFKMDDVRNIKLTADQMMPAAVFGHLRRSLETFLNPTDSWNNRLTLAHKDIEAAVRQRYMKGTSDQEIKFHKLLAGYFYQLADTAKLNKFDGNNPRAFTELPYHLVYCGEFKELQHILCNLNFIQAKCQLGLATQLMDDFQEKELSSKMAEKEQNKIMNMESVKQYKMFVSRQIHVLNSYPALTWQQALNEPDTSVVHTDAAESSYRVGGRNYMSWNNKPTTTDPCYMTISNLPQPVTCVAVSRDSKYFAFGGMDCMVRLYDFNTGKELHTFRGHANAITSVCFIGQSMMCSAGLDNVVSVWHVEQGHRIHALSRHNRRVQSCASDKAGKFFASASWDCTVKVWNAVKGDMSCELLIGSPVNCVDFHPEGQLIVTGSWDATLKIWDIFHRQRKAILRGHKTSVRDVAYSPSGRHIASAALDGDVKVWSAFNGTQVGNIQGHSLPINKLIFSPSGQELITVSDDHKVKVWSGNLGKPLQCLGQEDYGAAMSVVLNPNCDVVYVGYHSGDVRSFDAVTGWEIYCVKPHTASVRCIAYSEEGMLVTGSDDNSVAILNEMTGDLRTRITNNKKPVLCVSLTKHYLAVGSEDFTCTLYPAPKEKYMTKRAQMKPYCTLRGHVGPVTSCTFNSDGTKLASASRDASIRIYDISLCMMDDDPEPLQILHDCHKDWITGCQWSNIADILVTSSIDFNLKVWDAVTGKEKSTLTGHMAGINSMSYSYGCVVSCCSDGSVKVWSHKGTEITTLYGHSQRVTGCDMVVKVTKETTEEEDDPQMSWADMVESDEANKKQKKSKRPGVRMDDVLVATCSDDGTVRIWQPLQANELASMTGHDDRVVSVASDKQGRLCTSSLDKSVRLWSPELSTERADTGHNGPVTFVECIENGNGIITGSRDGCVRFWYNTPNGFVCDKSIKISSKSVNAACYHVDKEGACLVTAGDDGSVVLWNVKKDGFKIQRVWKRLHFVDEELPVTCLLKAQEKTTLHIYSAGWNGTVTVFKDGSVLAKKCIVDPIDWILSLYQTSANPGHLYATTANGMMIVMNIQYDKKCSIQIKMKINIPNTVDTDVAIHKQQPILVYCVAGDTKQQIIGDSKGQITNKNKKTTRVHGDAITCCQITEDVIFTGSLDRTVKVWNKDLNQVGLFFCQAPVTSMNIIKSTRNPYLCVSLACGDELGNIHFLTWKSMV